MNVTPEEKKEMFEMMHTVVHNSFKRIEKRIADTSEIQIEDMSRFADIMKDLSEVEKNIAKIKMYTSMHHTSGEVI